MKIGTPFRQVSKIVDSDLQIFQDSHSSLAMALKPIEIHAPHEFNVNSRILKWLRYVSTRQGGHVLGLYPDIPSKIVLKNRPRIWQVPLIWVPGMAIDLGKEQSFTNLNRS